MHTNIFFVACQCMCVCFLQNVISSNINIKVRLMFIKCSRFTFIEFCYFVLYLYLI